MMGADMDDMWWVDIVEGEAKKEEEAQWLLKHSPMDQMIVDNLRIIRNSLKKMDEVQLPESAEYYKELHNKIMNQLESEEEKQLATSPSPRP